MTGGGCDDWVAFHVLELTNLIVGDNATIGHECVLHAPLQVEDNLTYEAGRVLFRATVADSGALRQRAIVSGEVVVREGTIVPEYALIETQEQADALPAR